MFSEQDKVLIYRMFVKYLTRLQHIVLIIRIITSFISSNDRINILDLDLAKHFRNIQCSNLTSLHLWQARWSLHSAIQVTSQVINEKNTRTWTFKRTFLIELSRILLIFSRQLWSAARFPRKPDRFSQIARDQGGSNLSRDRSRSRRVPGSSCYILITYLSGRQDREEGQSRRRRKIEVDGPRGPFVCGNGLPTKREGEGGSDRVMATRAGRTWGGPAKRERGRTGGKGRHQGRVILAPRHVTPVVDRLLGHSTKATTGDDASSTAIKARLVASTVRSAARSLSRGFLFLPREATGWLSVSISLRGYERARYVKEIVIKPEPERPDGERVRTGYSKKYMKRDEE